ncbi:hypothetical protein RF683_06420 [Flavobacterium sp. 20NA77.7]|uniref:Uncharacterized protein n=1 Tax=Flavobacterium nakdongensis TaxID=3073563 RepID=A0ABY9R8G1_9FLAO|nr:hypothetical protein [Flavobacterium sp. 20NA77.7]WMW77128.1 hypothetical protein RF683_06420 [Flavobacterium sp. 20NA77.7]
MQNNAHEFKINVIDAFKLVLQDKIDVYESLLDSLTTDAQNDAKSSAGDKHETTLSKLHIEQEKIAIKLKEAYVQLQQINKIDASKKANQVVNGSLVVTNHVTVLICTALPKITVNNQSVFAISPQSPLGVQLMGKTTRAIFQVNQVSYTIETII